MDKSRFTGILLAGGKGSRLGVNKALANFRGKALADYPLKLLADHCKKVIISTNVPLPYPYSQINDITSNCGPMVGIYSCMLHAITPYTIVLSCDMPFLNSELIKALAEKAKDDKIIVPIHSKGFMEPLCAIYPLSLIDALGQSVRQKKLTLHEFILSHNYEVFRVEENLEEWNENLFININTLNELSAHDKS